ncbi:helix-turn-helix domain-containing protein [Streptomyces sp. I05A-00742]|uniref:helix-turn-helix domain-containing protein n=1 Tax=Streptomyces sp. I05A-00742 TaxID=2732853 RepID=UPI002896DD02|nr:helix-turn-helix domain-containing protein [Streptomyces sp. I05A-00742]
MSRDTAGDAMFAVLELLDGGAPPDRYEALLADARRAGADAGRLAALERAVRLGLSVRSRIEAEQQQAADLTALLDTSFDMAAHRNLGTLMKAVVRRARLLLSADMAWMALHDESQDGPVVRASEGHITDRNMGLRVAPGTGLGSATIRQDNPSPFWTPDYLADERIDHSPAIDDVVRVERLRAILAVPMVHGTRPVGALYIGDRQVRHYTPAEVTLFGSLASLATVAIEQVRLTERNASLIAELEHRTTTVEAGLRGARGLSDTHHRLIELVLDDGDLSALAAEVRRELDADVRIFAADGTLLTTAGDPPECGADQVLISGLRTHAAREPVEVARGFWAVPIAAGTGHLGMLMLRRERRWTAAEERLIRLVAQAVSVQLLVESSRTAITEGQVREDFLGHLLLGPQRPPRQLELSARRLGIDLAKDHVVVVARPEGEVRGRPAVWASSYAYRQKGLKAMHHGCAVLLLPGTDPGAAARAVSAELAPLLEHPVTVGAAGPVADPASVPRAFQEALRCLEAMTSLGATGRAGSLRDLGFLGVLLSDHHDVEGFVHSALGPVLDYDEQRFTDLTRTLETYFEAGGSPTNAAKKLHVHPNTVARRLERIGELLGPGWQEPARALEVQLALRVFRVRDTLGRPAAPPAPDAAPDGPQDT